ncbi:MAG: peptide-methionine (S)-S-oxide reductase MsrA [Waddliaceae bacterium]
MNHNKEIQHGVATFAGGCFWCVEHAFDRIKGVVSTTSGYTGGDEIDPSYEDVCSGRTNHVEAVEISFDPKVVTYEELLKEYFYRIDPTRDDGQFCDIGKQYRPIIFYHNDQQQELAMRYKQILIDSNKFDHVLVQILPAMKFYPAESYHQRFHEKSPMRYESYSYNSGREKRLSELWTNFAPF